MLKLGARARLARQSLLHQAAEQLILLASLIDEN
ncbi:hypothetical protein Psta_1540 [Pirellula staleyi DSM 6068]|uniref:Uncharacterized protein n=1 Tax=Pirellula staleyi (strain ATCC 27377 / DSM 6068 / ICPB 4128) TaxID=530564 RepID=D2QXN0_PIRSD|nr:hypothetical protein Psta_1540 [Pirellula staleyi DSM 6068]